jgi:hypothetical protein
MTAWTERVKNTTSSLTRSVIRSDCDWYARGSYSLCYMSLLFRRLVLGGLQGVSRDCLKLTQLPEYFRVRVCSLRFKHRGFTTRLPGLGHFLALICICPDVLIQGRNLQAFSVLASSGPRIITARMRSGRAMEV